ncbi:nucleotidyltransferase family protein [Methanogenium sp. S4BF]|uniref:nucleotidyltransferase domain-containing protein n=1 Tax=Methanogenium sp. S4BF TaxID=1789226 RepID=UPI002415E5E5|nr:nucleotidyltransferase family protein [Methanogenium sp. S4BF]WFN33517.1 nucleotidyltransferase family protein [Methanogenium sp. S4BF]
MASPAPVQSIGFKHCAGQKSIRNLHTIVPLAGDPPNALLALPDDLLEYLLCIIRNTPVVPPACSTEEWDALLTLLRPHGIFPLLAFHLKEWDEECLPPKEIMAFFSRIFMEGCARNLRLGRQVRTVTTALEDAGIPAILLKGHALARTVYPDPALRHSSDIDILVKPDDIIRCEPIFEKLGYSCPNKTFHTSRYSAHHQNYYLPGKGIPVELHWVTDSGYGMFSPDWLDNAFDRKIPIHADDLSCYTLDPASHLTFLAYHHVFQHQSLRLDWVYDIASLMNSLRVPEDWETLRSTCVQNHIRIPLEIALTAGSLWAGAAIPEAFADFSGWGAASDREERLWRYAKNRGSCIHSGMYLTLQGMPSHYERVRYCYRFILPHRESMNHYKQSESPLDIPFSHIRRWMSIRNYKL